MRSDQLEISYRPRRGSRRLSIVRHRFGPPVVNYPAQLPLSQVRAYPAVRMLEEDMRRKLSEPVVGAMGDGYRTRFSQFSFQVGEGLAARMGGRSVQIVYPADAPYDSYRVQRFAFNVLKRVLRIEGEYIFPRMVAERAAMRGLSHSVVRVRDSLSVWGSCSGKGALNFSLYALLLPDACLDYLVWHELAHLTHMNHSESFWSLLTEYLGRDAWHLDRQVNSMPLSVPSLF